MSEQQSAVKAPAESKEQEWLPSYMQPKERPPMRADAISARIAEMQGAGVKTVRMAVESGVSRLVLEAWIKGNRDKDTTASLSTWIQDMDKELAKASGNLIMTPTAARILAAFEKAREPRGKDGRRGIAAVFGASGASKTATAKFLESVDRGVVHLQINGECKTYVSILKGILAKRQKWGYPATGESVTDAVLRVLGKGDLIILDHAQLLRTSLIEQLMVFPDEHGIALALIGNTAGYKSLVDSKTKQILSRVGGALVHVEIPGEEEVDAILEAEGISGAKAREFCLMVGRQDGGLRYLYEAIHEARKLKVAKGSQRLDENLLKLGAVNAGVWGAQS